MFRIPKIWLWAYYKGRKHESTNIIQSYSNSVGNNRFFMIVYLIIKDHGELLFIPLVIAIIANEFNKKHRKTVESQKKIGICWKLYIYSIFSWLFIGNRKTC